MCVCMYACVYIRTYVRTYVCMYVRHLPLLRFCSNESLCHMCVCMSYHTHIPLTRAHYCSLVGALQNLSTHFHTQNTHTHTHTHTNTHKYTRSTHSGTLLLDCWKTPKFIQASANVGRLDIACCSDSSTRCACPVCKVIAVSEWQIFLLTFWESVYVYECIHVCMNVNMYV